MEEIVMVLGIIKYNGYKKYFNFKIVLSFLFLFLYFFPRYIRLFQFLIFFNFFFTFPVHKNNKIQVRASFYYFFVFIIIFEHLRNKFLFVFKI